MNYTGEFNMIMICGLIYDAYKIHGYRDEWDLMGYITKEISYHYATEHDIYIVFSEMVRTLQ